MDNKCYIYRLDDLIVHQGTFKGKEVRNIFGVKITYYTLTDDNGKDHTACEEDFFNSIEDLRGRLEEDLTYFKAQMLQIQTQLKKLG